jgi:hypothetical protein
MSRLALLFGLLAAPVAGQTVTSAAPPVIWPLRDPRPVESASPTLIMGNGALVPVAYAVAVSGMAASLVTVLPIITLDVPITSVTLPASLAYTLHATPDSECRALDGESTLAVIPLDAARATSGSLALPVGQDVIAAEYCRRWPILAQRPLCGEWRFDGAQCAGHLASAIALSGMPPRCRHAPCHWAYECGGRRRTRPRLSEVSNHAEDGPLLRHSPRRSRQPAHERLRPARCG